MTTHQAIRIIFLRKFYGSFVIFLLGFAIAQYPSFDLETSLVYLKTLIFPLSILIISYIFAPKIQRADIYQLLVIFLDEISGISIILSMYLYLENLSATSFSYLRFYIPIIAILICSILSIWITRYDFIRGMDRNISSKKLDIDSATWDLMKETYWSSKENEEKKTNWIIMIIILILFFVAYLSFLLAGGVLREFVLLAYSLFAASTSGRKLNLFFQFIRWEKEFGKPIQLIVCK